MDTAVKNFLRQKLENSQSTGGKNYQIHGEFTVAFIAIKNSHIRLSDVKLKHRFCFQNKPVKKLNSVDINQN